MIKYCEDQKLLQHYVICTFHILFHMITFFVSAFGSPLCPSMFHQNKLFQLDLKLFFDSLFLIMMFIIKMK